MAQLILLAAASSAALAADDRARARMMADEGGDVEKGSGAPQLGKFQRPHCDLTGMMFSIRDIIPQ